MAYVTAVAASRAFRLVVVLGFGLLVAGCGGGGSLNPDPVLPPSAPGSFTVELAPTNDALLRWTAPTPSADRAPVTDYAVNLELPGGGQAELGKTKSLSYLHSHSELSPGTRYVFHVRALSAAGPSRPSASAFVDVPSLLPPEAPGSFTVELTPTNDALLRWTAPTPSADRAPVTDYAVYLESPGGGHAELGKTKSLSYLHSHSELSPGTRYVFHVRALSDAGPSEASASAFVDVPPELLRPEAPGSFTVELTPDNEALLRWTAPPASVDRSPVTGYEVYLEAADGQSRPLGVTDSLSYLYTGLSPGTRYVFHVRARSAVGPSPPSASAFVDVPPSRSAPEAPGSFTVELTPDNEALLRWTAPPASVDRSPVTGYAVYLESPGGQAERLGETDSLSYLHSGLMPATRYVFHVRALSDAGPSEASASAFVDVPPARSAPEAPGSFTAELTPDNEALLRWTAPPASVDRSPVTGYAVYLESPDGQAERLGETRSLSYRHTGLLPGIRYVFHVRALSAVGSSEASASAFVDVPGAPVVPLAVPHVSVRADEGGGKAVISWVHRLVPDISTAVAGFAVQYCQVVPAHTSDHCGHALGWQQVEQNGEPRFPPTTRSFDDEFECVPGDMDPPPPVARMYRVRALADEPSASSRWSVPTRPVCPSADYSPPRRVDAVFAVDPGPDRVNICWEAPEDNGSPVTGYELQIKPDDVLPVTEDGWLVVDAHITPSTSPVCRLYSGLAGMDVRWFRIRAYNLAGHGHWSAPYHYRHGPAVVPEASARSVQSRPALAVADARAREGEDAALLFEVTLDRAASEPVTVDYATADGTARAGADYRPASGTLEFAAGESSIAVEVDVLDDAMDEGVETFLLRLTNASGARIGDGEATGTIENDGSIPGAWLARFGRTIAGQVVDAVGARLEGEAGAHVAVGGMSLRPMSAPGPEERLQPAGIEPEWGGARERPQRTRSLTERELRAGSSFHFVSAHGGPAFAAWGRLATSGFEGGRPAMHTDGDASTGLLGADVEWDGWLAGAALSYTEADGSFGPLGGTTSEGDRPVVESTLTGVYPYAHLRVSDRVSLWGLAGAGRGRLAIAEDGRMPIETDVGMTMGSIGVRGTVLSSSEESDFDLFVRSDAFWARTSSDEIRSGTTGHLAHARGNASRLRFSVEGARAFALDSHRTLTPTFEVGVRRDGGDAETGAGLDAGAGVRYSGDGIAIEGSVRKLVVHRERGYEEWEAAGSVRIHPGASGTGLSLTLAPAVGTASGGSDPLWSLGDVRGVAGDVDVDARSRFEAEVGYGMRSTSTRGVLTPYVGVSLSGGGMRVWRLGARWAIAPDMNLRIDGRGGESSDVAPEEAVILRGDLRW